MHPDTPLKISQYALYAILLVSAIVVQQNDPVEQILANLDTYATNLRPNKVYLQTDKSTYALEDTVWFKAYALDATDHYPTADSKVIYVDILDGQGTKVLGKKLYTENLGAASDFLIERTWEPGSYQLRAYTKYMLNYDQAYIYHKEIQIVDINKSADENFNIPDTGHLADANTSPPSLDIRFFPESGDLVAGIDSRVAIKIEHYTAALAGTTGSIEDASGEVVATFRIYEKGYGLALFKPKARRSYFAKLDNNPTLYPLPEVKAKGYNISINRSVDFSITVSSNVKLGLSDGSILIHSRGRVMFHKKLVDVAKDSYKLKINAKELPTGVAHVTFFDKDGIPRSERLFFVDNDLSESVIKTDKSIYAKKEKVDLSLSVINSDAKSFDCAVSVFEKSSLEGARPADNIKSWMLLNSDLRGAIKDPTFYFEQPGNHQRSILLDLVMMTHGWRRFNWDDLRQEDTFEALEHTRELGLYVKGSTSRLFNDKKPVKSTVVLNLLNNSLGQDEVVTGDDGRFEFGPYYMVDSVLAVIQARRYNEKNNKEFIGGNKVLDISIDTSEYLNLEKPRIEKSRAMDYAAYRKFIAANENAQALKDEAYSMEVMLSEVVLSAKRKTVEVEVDEYVKSKSYYGAPSNRLILDDQDRSSYRSVLDFLRQVPGVQVRGTEVIIRGGSSWNYIPPLFLLDGVPVNLDVIQLISPLEVSVIDVLKGPDTSIFGARGAQGVIAIYTGRISSSSTTQRRSGIVDLIIKGFDTHRQFYSPEYAQDAASIYTSDVRTTLYWNPYVALSMDEENALSFFTSDNSGNYIVVTEGLSADGTPIFGSYEFSVQ